MQRRLITGFLSVRPGRRSWRSRAVRAVGIATISIFVCVVESLRDRPDAIPNRVRAFNRRWFNPWMLRLAGRGLWPVARFEHRGRRSGALHATPILAWPVAGGFIIPMPYGTDVDWAANLRHVGEASVKHHGVRYRVGQPRIVASRGSLPELPALIRRSLALSGVRHVMRVDILNSLTPAVNEPA